MTLWVHRSLRVPGDGVALGSGVGVSTAGEGLGEATGPAGFFCVRMYRAIPKTARRTRTMMVTATAVFRRCCWAFMEGSLRDFSKEYRQIPTKSLGNLSLRQLLRF